MLWWEVYCLGCLISCRGHQEQCAIKNKTEERETLPHKFRWEGMKLRSNKCTHVSFPSQLPFGSQMEKGSKSPVITPAAMGWGRALLFDRKGVRSSYILFVLPESSASQDFLLPWPCFLSRFFFRFPDIPLSFVTALGNNQARIQMQR